MLVGDVRCATAGFGSSWKLSGGSMLSSAVTNVSKKPQVRRAISRSAWASSAEIGGSPDSCEGRLIQRAMAGASSHRTMNGAATGVEPGLPDATSPAATMARPTPPAIWR